ncbi:hypothetical protein J7J26_03455 [Candidatus Micrarchaeota archaeon]|nr:hypothetical protein [Candidatus Micrarchaeota archaeon]
MIKGARILEVNAKRESPAAIQGLGINIALNDVIVKGKDVTINYTYTVRYEKGVGELKMIGEVYFEEDAKKVKEIEKQWKDKKSLPNDFAEIVLNSINYTCSTNGVLVVRPVNLSPPMIPPRIQLGKAGRTAKA